MIDKEQLYEELERSPRDWQVRLALIEMAIREGDTGTAKRLVRASPSDLPTPPAVQLRIHTLLTQGIVEAPAKASEMSKASEAPAKASKVSKAPLAPEGEKKGTGSSSGPLFADSPATSCPSSGESRIEDSAGKAKAPSVAAERASISHHHEVEGGLSALIESEVAVPASKKAVSARHKSPHLERDAAKEKWANYDGAFELAPVDLALRPDRPSSAPERFSALSLALMVHVAVFLLVGLVAVQTQRPKPPQLVVSIAHEKEAELTTTRITRPNLEIKPTAAAPAAIDVINSISSSAFSVPDTENSGDLLVSSLYEGDQPMGLGMSFSLDTGMASDINFFGISGSGNKIVFIIDASPKMLVDEKGGMDAYDKVKEEVGIMLANLNRGTHFNLLLYDGKRLIGFRDELVPGLPSNLRMAIEWLDPVNREYEALGLRSEYGDSFRVSEYEGFPIQAGDIAHYAKAVQQAMEWHANAIFCIVSGYESMSRALTPEMLAKRREMAANAPSTDTRESREEKAWREAIEKTRLWLEKENAARAERGVALKVVISFNQLVREVTGASPPTRERSGDARDMPRLPPVTPEDIEEQVTRLVRREYKGEGLENPSLHMVVFLGEGQKLEEAEDHFLRLTRKNRGKLKVLRGLAGLKNVTDAK